jgi:hypothetical protein
MALYFSARAAGNVSAQRLWLSLSELATKSGQAEAPDHALRIVGSE